MQENINRNKARLNSYRGIYEEKYGDGIKRDEIRLPGA